MKTCISRLLYVLSAASASLLITFSCTKEDEKTIVPSDNQEEEQPQDPVNPTEPGTDFIATGEGVSKSVLIDLTPTWVDGDAIGVNGVECEWISDNSFNGSDVSGDGPFYAVYPYSTENIFSGDVLTAEVPAIQTVGAGQNVAPGALVAACKSENRTLEFKNCVSLLQITIPRDDIKQVEVSANDGEYLAGKFTMDVTASPLAPAVVSSDPSLSTTVTLASSGDALAPGTYYIAVLPGELTKISLTFTNTADETVNITKTGDFTMARSSGANFGTVFTYEISTPAELLKWAKESAKFTTWDVVNLKANLDMSSLADSYKEAVDFKGVFHGNDHTISGLTTPMFSRLVGASVDNLTLESAIEYSGNTSNMKGNNQAIGLLTHVLALGNNPEAKTTNVTTKGSLRVDLNSDYDKYFAAGGLAGSTNGVPLEGCKNYADITISKINITGAGHQLRVGGLAGQLQTASADIKECENHGNIEITKDCSIASECIVGGIIGFVTTNEAAQADLIPLTSTFDNCDNYGNVTNSAAEATGFFTGGILGTVGYYDGTNYKKTNEEFATQLRWEGEMKKCDNSGAVEDNSEYATAVPHYVGGILAWTDNKGGKFSDCTNNNTVKLTAKKSTNAIVGGLFGLLYNFTASGTTIFTQLARCENKSNGDVTVNTQSDENTYASGMVGYSNAGPIKLLDCSNSGDVTNNGTASSSIRIGGLVGHVAKGGYIGDLENDNPVHPCYNNGFISSDSGQEKAVHIGGLLGSSTGTGTFFNIYGSQNEGNVSFTSSAASVDALYAGGIAGNIGTSPTIKNCTSNCDVSKTATSITTINMGEIIGRTGNNAIIQNCQLAGSVDGTNITGDNYGSMIYGRIGSNPSVSGNSYLSD